MSESKSPPDYGALAREAAVSWHDELPAVIGVDTETEGTGFYDPAFCVTVSWRNMAAEIEDHYIELAEEDHSDVAREILAGTPVWAFHNAKFDLQKLILAGLIKRHEITVDRFEDTEALAHLEDSLRLKGLKYLSELLFGDTNEEEEAVKKAMRKAGIKLEEGYHLAPREVMIPYAKKDTNKTVRLLEYFLPRVKEYPELWELYQHEKEVTLALLDIEARGLRIDVGYVTSTLGELNAEFLGIEQRISELVGKPVGKDAKAGEFNPGSPQQLADYFQAKGYESRFKTKKGQPSYGKEFLAECTDPLGPLLTEYRRVTKLKNTYFLAMRNEHRNGVLHPHFRQHGTKTGRFSSGEAEDE
jgi:DNA polymerase I-like protein with 3'-5' exonuclease and polymerase domains